MHLADRLRTAWVGFKRKVCDAGRELTALETYLKMFIPAWPSRGRLLRLGKNAMFLLVAASLFFSSCASLVDQQVSIYVVKLALLCGLVMGVASFLSAVILGAIPALLRAARLFVVAVPCAVSSLLFGGTALAQTQPNLENGFKDYGSYHGSNVDTVQLSNGNWMLHAPLIPDVPQRGDLTVHYFAYASSKNWQIRCIPNPPPTSSGETCFWTPGGGGVSLQRSNALGLHRTVDIYGSGTGSVTYEGYGYTLNGPDGATHQLYGIPGTEDANGDATVYESVDTTGYHVALSNQDSYGIWMTATVIDRQGNQYMGNFGGYTHCGKPQGNMIPAPGNHPPLIDDAPFGDRYCSQSAFMLQITDANGNWISYLTSQSQNPGVDTLGRGQPFESGTTTSDYSGCVSRFAIIYALISYYNGPNGSTQQIKTCYAAVPFQTAFNATANGVSVIEAQNYSTNYDSSLGGYVAEQLVTLVLADGSKWTFDYDNYLEVTSVGLPTGGSINLTWTTINFSSCNPPDPTYMSRAVASRTLNDNNGHSYTWNYNWGTPSNGGLVNTITDPSNNDTVHSFTALSSEGSTAGCFFYETRTQDYQGTGSSRQLLKQVDTTYSSQAFSVATSAISVVGNVLPISIQTTVYPSGKVSLVTKSYDTGLGSGAPIFANVVTEKDYDWGQGAAGPLVREIDRTYQWQNDSRYLTAHLLDLAGSEVVKDGSGCRRAETDYTYDEPAYLSVSGISTHHGTPPNPSPVRGNPTSVTRQQFASNSCPTTTQSGPTSHTNWYDTGQPYKTIDALNNPTTHTYDSFYAGAYSTQTCNALNQCVSGTYDFNTGLLTSFTDQNASYQASGNTSGDPAHTSFYQYNDPLWRITQAQSPPDASGNRPQTAFSYSAANSFPLNIQRTKFVTTALNDIATNYFDGLGRVYKSQHATPNGTSTVDTTYDGFDHVIKVFNPYFSTSDPTYGVIQTQYDALGRATQVTKQDGSVVATQYNQTSSTSPNADCAVTSDEVGNPRKTCSDALGRLIEVDEPQASSVGTNASASVTISGSLQVAETGSAIPLAASGSKMTGFSTSDGVAHSFYITSNQHIIHAFWSSSAGWQALDVTAVTSPGNSTNYQPVSGTNLTGLVNPSGAYSIYFLDSNQHIHESYTYNGSAWSDHDITSLYGLGAAASGSPLISYLGSGSIQMHVTYVGSDTHIHDLYQNSSAVWADKDVTANSNSSTTTNHQPVAGTPLTGLLNPGGGAVSFYFLDANQHIHETYCHNDEVWYDNDFTNLFGLVTAASGTALMSSTGVGSIDMYVNYVGTDQHIHAVYHNLTTGWSSMDVTANSNSSTTTNHVPVSGTPLTGLLNPGGNAVSFYFLDANQHIHETYDHNDVIWYDNDVTTLFGLGATASNTTLISYPTSTSIDMHVHYERPDQHVHDMHHNSTTGWSDWDVNGLAALNVADSGTVSLSVGSFTATACFGASTNSVCTGQPMNTGAAQVAAALAQSLNAFSSPVTATVSGSTISITLKTPGPFTPSVSPLSTAHDNSSLFPNPSFTSPATNFSGGTGGTLSNPYVTLYSYDALGNLLNVTQKGGTTDSTQWRVRSFTYDSLSRLLTANNPESGTISYSYDANGNLLQKTSLAPNQTGTATQTISYCFDPLNRVTGRAYSAQTCINGQLPTGTAVVSYFYDQSSYQSLAIANGIGRLTGLSDQAGTGAYSFDALGRISSEQRSIGGIQKTLSYTYNLDSSLATLRYPSGALVNYPLWNNGSVATGAASGAADSGNNINYVTSANYQADGQPTAFVTGNSGSFAGITNSFSFNNRLQPVTMSASTPSQTVFSIGYDFHFGIGDNGNVYGITNYRDQSRIQAFTYDALNRLTSAQNSGTDCSKNTVNGASEYWGNSYVYDAWGNLLQKNVTKCRAEGLGVVAYSSNQIHMNSGPDYSYDAAGNMTHDATTNLNYVFDQENRISGAGGYSYTYDADGNRVEKSNGSTGTIYWYMTPGIVAESDLTGTLKSEYVFFDGERVARKDLPGAGVSYYFSDHLKTASVITDSQGTIKEDEDYYPWGGELQFVNSDSNHYKFTGKERDSETNLDYFGARYYANWTGRFITPDWSSTPVPVPYADLEDPQSLNQYSYVRNIPTMKVDPDGHCCDLVDVVDFFVGLGNALASDNMAGAGRFESGTTANNAGHMVGDGIAMVQGVAETMVGGGGEAVSTAADATGVGAVVGVPGNIISGVVIIHGSTTFTVATQHLLKKDGGSNKRAGDFTEGEKKQLDKANADANGGQNKCTECGQDVQSVQNKKGQTPPGNQLQRHHDPPLSRRGNSRSPKNRIVCRTCHVKIHRQMRNQQKKTGN